LANVVGNGKMNANEFCVAMHLIFRRKAGKALPSKLPEELVPTSYKTLSNSLNELKLSLTSDKPKSTVRFFSFFLFFHQKKRG